MDLEERIYNKFIKTKTNSLFNWKVGLIGGSGMGIIAAGVNSCNGLYAALEGGLNQFAYTFLVGGIVTGLCGYISRNFDDVDYAQFVSVILPTSFTTIATYLWHSYNGTSEPFLTTLPTFIVAYKGTELWSNMEIRAKSDIRMDKFMTNRLINNKYTRYIANMAYGVCK